MKKKKKLCTFSKKCVLSSESREETTRKSILLTMQRLNAVARKSLRYWFHKCHKKKTPYREFAAVEKIRGTSKPSPVVENMFNALIMDDSKTVLSLNLVKILESNGLRINSDPRLHNLRQQLPSNGKSVSLDLNAFNNCVLVQYPCYTGPLKVNFAYQTSKLLRKYFKQFLTLWSTTPTATMQAIYLSSLPLILSNLQYL